MTTDWGGKPYVPEWREAWGGVDVTARSWTAYFGTGVALGIDIREPGWRLRSTGGYGQYLYKQYRLEDGERRKRTLRGRKAYSDFLLGYQWNEPNAVYRAYGGAALERHILDPRDPKQRSDASELSLGAKGVLEAWYALPGDAWLGAEASFTHNPAAYKLAARYGHGLNELLDLGLEWQFDDDRDYRAGRVGLFATYKLGKSFIGAAAGVGSELEWRPTAYGRVNVYYRY